MARTNGLATKAARNIGRQYDGSAQLDCPPRVTTFRTRPTAYPFHGRSPLTLLFQSAPQLVWFSFLTRRPALRLLPRAVAGTGAPSSMYGLLELGLLWVHAGRPVRGMRGPRGRVQGHSRRYLVEMPR